MKRLKFETKRRRADAKRRAKSKHNNLGTLTFNHGDHRAHGALVRLGFSHVPVCPVVETVPFSLCFDLERRQLVAVAAAQPKLRAVLQHDDVLAVRVRQEFFDARAVDDGGAVDAQEDLRVELRFERVHRFAQQVRLPPRVQPRVAALGFDPVNLLSLDK